MSHARWTDDLHCVRKITDKITSSQKHRMAVRLCACLASSHRSEVQGQSPGGDLGAKPPEAPRMLRHEAEKWREKNKSIQTDIVWQSTHPFMFSTKTQSAGSRASEMVHNGSRFCGATSAVQSVVFCHAGDRIRSRNNIGLIKPVSWKKRYCNVRKLVKWPSLGCAPVLSCSPLVMYRVAR